MAILKGTPESERYVRYLLDCTGLSESEYALMFKRLSTYVDCRGPIRRNPVDPNLPCQFIPIIRIVIDKAATIALGTYACKKAIDVVADLIREIGKEVIKSNRRKKTTFMLKKPDGTRVKLTIK